MAKNKIFQRVLIVLASLGVYACNGGGDFGSDGSTEDSERVPVVENQEVVIEPTEIASGGTTMLSVTIVYSREDVVTEPVDIEWNSQCAAADPPLAVITPQLQIETGVYEAEYRATGCVGDDVITVNLDGTLAANGVVTILSSGVGTVQFVSAEPDRIALSGFGSADFPEFSDVTFRVLDSKGLPVGGRTVDFELTNTLGGISLVKTSAVSGDDGYAVARVQSGTINTTVRVVAAYTTPDGLLIQTVSGPVAINSGLADQNSMDIATTVFNPLAWNYNYSLDAAPVDISVYASDYYNNPVPDGTQITFVSENGGQITGNCATVNGACSVPWASSGERPANGVLTILARVVGEESFDDANGNGLFDVGEIALQDQLPEAWLDANENGAYDAGEDYYDFNSDGRYTQANNLYEGAGCTDEAKAAGHCAALIEVRQDIRLVMSGDDLTISFLSGPVILNTGGTEVCYTIEDGRGNIPPAATSVSVDASVGEIIAGSSSYTIPSAFSTDPYLQCVIVKGVANQGDGGEAESGFLTVTATLPAPSGLIIERSLSLTEFQEAEEQLPVVP